MGAFFHDLFDSSALAPHGFCLLWRPELVWTHMASDAAIGLAYFSIPLVLAYFVSKRRDIAFGWVFWAFAIFILACGTTHFFSIWTLWNPDYGTEAVIKAITGIASVLTAIGLFPLLPKALALPSPQMLRQANAALTEQIRERDAALAALEQERAERLKTEAMLRQSQKMEAVGQLTGGIAHDFNNLLTVVFAGLEKVERRLPADEAELHRAVQNALTGAERAATLTQQLLAFGRKQPLRPAVLNVNPLVENTVGLLRRTLPDWIGVETRLAGDLWLTRVDANQLESALLNLAVNARDAMPEGGMLTIETYNAGGPESGAAGPECHVVIAVSDTGAGMDNRVMEHAFEPFFTTKPVGQGSGLGLSQVYGFIKQSNGQVTLDSVPGRGTTVRLYLPREDASHYADAPKRETEAAPNVLQGTPIAIQG